MGRESRPVELRIREDQKIHEISESPNKSGQILATSNDRFPPNGGLVREIPLFQGNLGW